MEWFTNNSAALIAAVAAFISAVVAASVALISIWLNNRQNLQRALMQSRIDESKLKRQLMIEKGEELFTSLDNWFSSCVDINVSFIINLTAKDLVGSRKAITNYDEIAYSRMQTLISIYFPDFVTDFDFISRIQSKVTLAYTRCLTDDTDLNQTTITIQKLNSRLVEKSREMRLDLANEIKSFI